MTINIQIPVNTVITMVAPSNSGKSSLVEHLVNQLKKSYSIGYPKLNFHVVSSDQIRRELIGEDLHKHSNEMLFASGAAFDLLYCKLRNLLSFPLSLKNAVIFVDTTGLNKEFRDQVNKLADEFIYNKAAIILDYKEYQDYFKYVDESVDKSIISNGITRLRTKALPQMRSKDYPAGIFRIKQPTENFADITIELTNAEEYLSCWLPTEVKDLVTSNNHCSPYVTNSKIEYTILPDSHGCYDEVISVLTKAGFTIEEGLIKNPGNKRIVCLDDYIDKGNQQKELIQFFYRNQDYIYHVLANHEDFVVRYFTGDIKPDKDSLQYFDSINWLKDTPELEELKWLHSQAKPFLVHPDFICTHSPCKLKHLGKLDKESKKAQLKHRLPSIYGKDFETEEEYKAVLETNLSWLKEQVVSNFPFIFSGHLSFNNVVRLGSQVLLDTGAVYGNKLTACTIKGRRLEFTEVQSKKAYYPIKYLTTIFDKKDGVSLDSLDPKEQKRVKGCLSNKYRNVQFLSGTVSPSASSESELEPIETALEYYKSKGVTDLVMQPKFMGSRLQYYWLPDDERVYIVTRNGYLPLHLNTSYINDKLYSKVQEKFPDATLVILDGELCPWKALGAGLIDHHFTPIYSGMKAELEFCKENDFNTAISSLLSQAKEEFASDRAKLSKSELKAKYGDAKVEWYSAALKAAKYINPIDIDLTEVEAYKTELDGYTQDGELDFQPFQVLKIERGDQVEMLPFDNYEGFKLFNSNLCLSFKIEDDFTELVNYVKRIYQRWIRESQELFGYPKLEGVVIKPLNPKLTNVAPYIKVRNPQYLKLVYGPTYNLEPTYSKLVKSKRISRKIKSSISEWQLGLEMLGIHSSQMTLDNPKAVDLMIKFIAEEKKVEVLDPRL